jgi:hypothetical protein
MLSTGRYWNRFTVPTVDDFQVDDQQVEALQQKLRHLYWPRQMRGRHCTIQHHRRNNGVDYFFAYLDNWPDQLLAFKDDGELGNLSGRYAFANVFAFDKSTGMLDLAGGLSVPAAEQSAWISQESVVLAAVIAPRFHSPSQAEAVPNGTTFDTTELPGTSFFPPKAEEAEYAAIGNAVHSYMAALPSIRTLADADKVLVAERCPSAYSVSGLVPPPVLVSAGERFRKWVESTYPGALWHVEVPVSGPRSQGGQWAGTADLVLQLPGGAIAIIDHKSGPIRREHCAKKATEFAGQLSAYSEVFEQAGKLIDSMWIHFPLAGVVGQAKVSIQ